MNYNKDDKYEFEFIFNNSDPFYITHNVPYIDEELLLFLIDIELDFNNISGFKINKLDSKLNYLLLIKEIKEKFPFNKETDCKEKYNEIIQDFLYEEIITKLNK